MSRRIGPNTVLDETTWNSPNYTPASSVPAVYGQPRRITGITIHHWGVEGQRYENVANFLSRRGGNTSAHFVVEAGRAACLVSPEHAAWHAGSAAGNATTIGIECRPEMSDADFQSLVELVVYLEGIYGDMKIYGHKDWSATACPGKYYNKLGTLIERVNAAKAGASASAQARPATTSSMVMPVEGFRITQAFNAGASLATNLGGGHTGTDFATPVGTPVKAVAGGTVLFADWARNLPTSSWEARWYLVGGGYGGLTTDAGIVVVIDHGDFLSVSAHLNETHLNNGNKVGVGEVIGKSGNTGYTTGAHLHFEILPKPFKWTNGWYGRVDPIAFIGSRKASAPTAAPATTAPTGEGHKHVVRPGETLSALTKHYYGTADAQAISRVTRASNITNPNHIAVGQTLTFPGVTSHKVSAGESVSAIARKYYGKAGQPEIDRIAKYNKLANPSRIEVGQYLAIPGK